MNHTSDTNGAVNGQGQNTTIIYSATFGGADPYRPTEVLDGNGYAAGGANHLGEWLYTWDTYGHCLTATSPYNITTTYTWNYTVFPMGELLQVQEGTKSPTTISYYEPSGLTKQVNVPQPGTVGSTQTVAYSATYSTLGNLLTVTGPGNNAAQTITTPYNYTQDGSYSTALRLRSHLTQPGTSLVPSCENENREIREIREKRVMGIFRSSNHLHGKILLKRKWRQRIG